jgi:hypothetical protein
MIELLCYTGGAQGGEFDWQEVTRVRANIVCHCRKRCVEADWSGLAPTQATGKGPRDGASFSIQMTKQSLSRNNPAALIIQALLLSGDRSHDIGSNRISSDT